MDLDLGGNYGALQTPTKPIHLEAPDATSIYLHSGENETEFDSFLKVISNLAQAFKFLPQYEQVLYESGSTTDTDYTTSFNADGSKCSGITQQKDPQSTGKIWGAGEGSGYSNLDFSPNANEWNLIDDENESVDTQAVIAEINQSFGWNTVKSAGGNKSYFDIAKGTDINSYDPEKAFNLMLSMLESKQRVLNVYKDMFGDAATLTDTTVKSKFDIWIAQFKDVDCHNLGVLKMFFGMQTDFLNTLDAYNNTSTTWGKNFHDTLKSKVDTYIGTLSDDKRTKAQTLEGMWFASAPRWDKEGTSLTGSVIKSDRTEMGKATDWANHVYYKISGFVADEIGRMMSAMLFSQSQTREYNEKKIEYEDKKDELIYQEIYLNKTQAKRQAESKQTMNRLSSRSKTNNAASKSKVTVARTAKTATTTTLKVAPARPAAVAAAASTPARTQSSAVSSAVATQRSNASRVAAANSAAKSSSQARSSAAASGANAANNSIAAKQSSNQRRKTGNPV
jgi:hypothetical protein